MFLREVVEKEGYETLLLSPNLYVKKDPKGNVEGALLVHVDDIQLAAMPTEGQRLKAKLEARFLPHNLRTLRASRNRGSSTLPEEKV